MGVRLAGDWALLANGETREVVQEFAKDQQKFLDAFSEAWQKVIAETHVKLSQCTGPRPTDKHVSQWLRAAKCQDSHRRCGKMKRVRCRNPVWIERCPVTCNRCLATSSM